ncbi:MAG: hypothetical protein ACE5D4_10780, partial [Thermodesulfobacteriota bacterium]
RVVSHTQCPFDARCLSSVETLIYLVPIMGIMSFVRKKSRRLKSGEMQDYYYLVENYWEGGKVRQRVLKYMGKSPQAREISLDPKLAGQLAQGLMASELSEPEVRDLLEKLNIPVPPGALNEVSLVYTPPQKSLVLRLG